MVGFKNDAAVFWSKSTLSLIVSALSISDAFSFNALAARRALGAEALGFLETPLCVRNVDFGRPFSILEFEVEGFLACPLV